MSIKDIFVGFLNNIDNVARKEPDASRFGNNQQENRATAIVFPTIGEVYQSDLSVGEYISVSGQLSTFAPLLPGSPHVKKDLHRRIRRNIQKIRELLKEKDQPITPTTFDSLMAFTAAQMVIRREHRSQTDYWHYLGLYQSIVRNSLPIFIESSYYDRHVRRLFIENKPASEVLECSVIGKIGYFSSYWEAVVKDMQLDRVFAWDEFRSLDSPLCLYVKGHIDGTEVSALGAPRYLDGDIWIAIEHEGVERVISRFLDIANPADLRQERQGLKSDCAELVPGAKIVAQYDNLRKPFLSDIIPESLAI